MNVCDTLPHGDITMCQIQYAYVEEKRIYDSDTNPCQKMPVILTFEVRGQGHTEVINVCDILSSGFLAMCQIWEAYVEEHRSYGPGINPCEKKHNFDLDVKGQGHIKIMNVLNTSSHEMSIHLINEIFQKL